ncbi:MAG: histone deacetylase [Desulfobacterales bacterium]|nr:histone deacetylase [Desulfobacterales bacterium]
MRLRSRYPRTGNTEAQAGARGLKIYHSDACRLPLPAGHTFPIDKYRLLRERVQAAGLVDAAHLLAGPAATEEDILRVHDPDYITRLQQGRLSRHEMRRIGFPWSPQLVERARYSTGSTLAAARSALAGGAGINLGGGTHHAFPDHGEGYCILNDVAISLRALQARQNIQTAVVIDCDVHQGNGTAAIFSGDPSVFTFSIHGRNNFPYRKVPGDLDIALEDDTADDEYLERLTSGLARALASGPFDLAVYLAGADPYQRDRFGRLALSRAGLAHRDRLVMDVCRQNGLPVAVTMSGGYARDTADTVAIHFETVRIVAATA